MKIIKYYIEPRKFSSVLAISLMLISACIRTVYYLSSEMTALVFWLYFINTVLASIIFTFVIVFCGKTHPQLTFIPVAMGVVFFIVKAFTFESLVHTVLCIFLYFLVLAIYSLTVFGIIPTKKLLYPLFGLPLLYHIFVEDMKLYVFAKPAVPFFEWLPEISILMIMGALFSLSFSLKRKMI